MNMNFEVKMEMPKVTFPKLPNIAEANRQIEDGMKRSREKVKEQLEQMPRITIPKLPNIAAMMESFTNGESEGGFMKSFQEAIRADAEAMAKAGAGNK